MAPKAQALAAVVLVVALFAAAPLQLARAAGVCNMSNDEFMTCQPAAAATTNPTPSPSADCCAALAKADLPCLCAYKSSPWLSLYNIDPKRAMELPARCGLTMPANC